MRDWLKQLRKDKGLTQGDLARMVNITSQYIYYIECGERRPTPELAQKIADILGFDWTMFYLPN